MAELDRPFKDTMQGIVKADGTLSLKFGPQANNMWDVKQVTLEMPTAPAGSRAEIRVMGALVAPSYSARRASASGDPPIFLYGGETATVEWINCTPGDIGIIWWSYKKELY